MKEARNYDEIKIMNCIIYSIFQSICNASNLLDDDKEWNTALAKASHLTIILELR